MCCAVAPKGPPRRESVLLGGEMSPSGDQNEQKGLREGRIAALLPRTLASGVNEAALLPWRSDSWPRLTYQSGCICPTTEPVSQACAWCMVSVHPFRNTPTGITVKVSPQRDLSEPAVIAHWGADPNRLSGKRLSPLFDGLNDTIVRKRGCEPSLDYHHIRGEAAC
jgi:hypothetical protein